MKKLLFNLIGLFIYISTSIFKHLLYLFTGKKVLLISYRFSYFEQIFQYMLEEVQDDFFIIYAPQSKPLFVKGFVVPYSISRYIDHHLFLSFETSAVNFPFRFIKSKKVQCFHGLGVYNIKNIQYSISRYDHFLIPNHYFKTQLDKNKCIEFGFPKLDYLLDLQEEKSLSSKELVYYLHWKRGGDILSVFEEVLNFSKRYDTKTLYIHNYLKAEYGILYYESIVALFQSNGFVVSNANNLFKETRQVDYLIDFHSSNLLEGLTLGFNVYGIEVFKHDCIFLNDLKRKWDVKFGKVFHIKDDDDIYCYNLGQTKHLANDILLSLL